MESNILRLPGNIPPPGLEKLLLGRDLWWKVAVLFLYHSCLVRQRPLVEGCSTIISIAFMFRPIYLRLEDNVPPSRNRNLPVQMESDIARLAAWWKIIFL